MKNLRLMSCVTQVRLCSNHKGHNFYEIYESEIMRKLLKPILALSILAFGGVSTSQYAAAEVVNQYDPEYMPEFADEIIEDGDIYYHDVNVLSDFNYFVTPVRHKDAKDGKIAFRITNTAAVTGCIKSKPPEAEVELSWKKVEISIIESVTRLNEDERDYKLNNCEVKAAAPYVDVVLDRDELIEGGVEKIEFSSKAMGMFMSLKTLIDKEKAFFLIPVQENINTVPTSLLLNGKNKYTYWFFPENTVVLYNETLEINDHTAQKISDFARRRGLVPITEKYKDFRTHDGNRHKMYFIDVDGAYAHQIKGEEVMTLGNIELDEIYHTASGAVTKPSKKPIYVKLPGVYD